MIKPGEIQKLKVGRKTDIGYILLTGENEELFLHNNETNFKVLKENSFVDAFLFYDNKQRLAATLYKPIITKDQSNWLEVTGVNPTIGVFLNNNINKDILFSKDELPQNMQLWPQAGDQLYVKLFVTKQFLAKSAFVSNDDIELFERGNEVEAWVHGFSENGINLLTKKLTPIFVEVTQLRQSYRLGEKVMVTINYQHNNYYSGSLTLLKEEQRLDDAQIILNHLKQVKKMNLTSDSSPEDIKQVFNMSKKAFKRAIGMLYKQRLIIFENNKTILVGEKK